MPVQYKIWSCKLKRPETFKSHRTIEAATKKAGEHGFVFCPETKDVYQVFLMSNGKLERFSTTNSPDFCNTGDFDMKYEMDKLEIPRPV